MTADEAPHPADDPAEVARHQAVGRAAASPAEWEDPLPLQGLPAELPPFPLTMLPEWVADLVKAVAKHADTPDDVAAFAALGTLGAATGRRAWISAKGQRVPINFYGVTGLASGQRKSGPFHAVAIVPLMRAQLLLQNDEDARAEMAKEDARQVRLFSTNPSPAGLRELMADNHQRMAVVSSEGGVFQELAGRYDKIPDLDLVLSGYDGHPFQADRATKSVLPMDEPVLSLSLTVQPVVLADAAGNAAFRDRGFLARLLYSLPKDVVGYRANERTEIPDDLKILYYDRMTDLLIRAHSPLNNPAEWIISDAAWKIFHDAEQRIEVKLRLGAEYGGNDGLREWASKFTGHLLRLTGLLHAAENCNGKTGLSEMPGEISEDTMRRAIKAMEEYFLPHAEATFGFMRAGPEAKEAEAVIEWIRGIDWTGETGGKFGKTIAGHPGVVTQREIVTAVWAIRDADHASGVLHTLEKAGYVRLTEAERRDSHRYAIHPSLFSSAVSALAVSGGVSAGQMANQSAEDHLCTSSALGASAETAEERRGGPLRSSNKYLAAETPSNAASAETAEEFQANGASAEVRHPWPASETGPCIRCGTAGHRYGDDGRSLCVTCQEGQNSRQTPPRQQPRHQTRAKRHK
jgi:replicative DNA helicase